MSGHDQHAGFGKKLDQIAAKYPQSALIRTIVREGISWSFGTPFLGSMIDDAVTGVIGRRESERVKHWLINLDLAFQQLDDSKLDRSFLGSEEHIELFVAVAERVARSHQAEKHEALRNAFVNASCTDGSTGPFKHIVVRLIGDLTVEHMRLLRIVTERDDTFTAEEREANKDSTSIDDLTASLPIMSRVDVEALASDLLSLGLLRDWTLGRYSSGQRRLFAPSASCSRFVRFIANPAWMT